MKLNGFVGEALRTKRELDAYYLECDLYELAFNESRVRMMRSFNKLAALALPLDLPNVKQGIRYTYGTPWSCNTLSEHDGVHAVARIVLRDAHDPDRANVGLFQIGTTLAANEAPSDSSIDSLAILNYYPAGGLQPRAINSREPFLPGTSSWEEMQAVFNEATTELRVDN